MLANKIDRWEAEIRQRGIERGIEQGIEREKALLRRQAERRFGSAAAEQLAAALADVTDADRLSKQGLDRRQRHDRRPPDPPRSRRLVAPIALSSASMNEPCTVSLSGLASSASFVTAGM